VLANAAFWDLLRESPDSVVYEWIRPELVALLERSTSGDGLSDSWNGQFRLTADGPELDVRLCRLKRHDKPLIAMIVRETSAPTALHPHAFGRQDPLTGLQDREFLLNRVGSLLRGNRAGDRQFAMLFLDLDNFKQVNDEFGHLVGDNVLREAARRIANCVREGDHVVRFGGDEFVVLVERVAAAIEIEPVVSRIRSAFVKPIAFPKGEVTLTLSIGVAQASDDYRTAEELLAAADRAMYAAKTPGRTGG
jgi:diguanylate cyclase (GGDEF)-like protein